MGNNRRWYFGVTLEHLAADLYLFIILLVIFPLGEVAFGRRHLDSLLWNEYLLHHGVNIEHWLLWLLRKLFALSLAYLCINLRAFVGRVTEVFVAFVAVLLWDLHMHLNLCGAYLPIKL